MALVACALARCTFTFDVNEGPLRFRRIDAQGDTVSAMPRITGVFSAPVVDSTVAFRFSPPFPASYTVIGSRHDTFTIVTSALLAGRSRYVIRPAGTILAINGASMGPTDDSIAIFTHPREVEPNGTPASADTLWRVVCGTLSSANDTDWYSCTDTSARAVWVRSFDSPAFLTVFADAQTPVDSGRRDVASDTIPLRGCAPPFFVAITPSQRMAAGYYEAGFTVR